jgi:SAM-dependent methyltransferase
MHHSSYLKMGQLLAVVGGDGKKVLDCGSMLADSGLQKTYRDHVEKMRMEYVGVDMVEGPNVDVVANLEEDWFIGEPFDIVISGQMLEHLQFPLVAVQTMKRAVKVGGYLIMIAPWQYGIHRHPIDCWRVLPDGMEFLLEGFENVEVGCEGNDCWGIGCKPEGYTRPWNISRL